MMKTTCKLPLIVLVALSLAMLVSGCSGSATAATTTPEATPLPAVKNSGPVVAEGKLVPAQKVEVSFRTSGVVEEVMVVEGETVSKGAVIARLSGNEKTLAEQAAAELDLLTAQQELQDLQENAALSLAEAKMKLAEAEKESDKAKRQRLSREYRIGSDNQLDIANADVIVAREQVHQAEDAYTSVSGLSETDMLRAGALSALGAARQRLDRAVANYNYLLSMPNTLEVNLADARLELAQANVDTAKALVSKYSAGPDPDAVAQLEARVHSIETRLAAAKAEETGLTMTAPISGVVVNLPFQAGEMVSPGSPTVLLADLSRFEVELVNLTEIQIGRVQPGQSAIIRFDAFPELEMQGTVERVAPLGENRQGDIVYTTTVALAEQNPDLRWNMTVTAELVP
jgi:HlyD family secretion protein